MILIREIPQDNLSQFGVLFINGLFHSYTLENYQKRIPMGEYKLTYYNSPKNKRLVPLLKDVPHRSMIEIHPANVYNELEGCIALGDIKYKSERLLNSTKMFDAMMALVQSDTNPVIRIYDYTSLSSK